MSTQQYHSASQSTVDSDGVKTYRNADGDEVQESAGDLIFRGLSLAGGDGFVSESEGESSEDDYTHHSHHHHAGPYIPQQPQMIYSQTPPQYASHPGMMAGFPMTAPQGMAFPVERKSSKKDKKSKKEKKEKKSKKERSGSSSSSDGIHHACSCGHSHH